MALSILNLIRQILHYVYDVVTNLYHNFET